MYIEPDNIYDRTHESDKITRYSDYIPTYDSKKSDDKSYDESEGKYSRH